MQNLSYENEFYLHVNENSFSYERLCTKIHKELNKVLHALYVPSILLSG